MARESTSNAVHFSEDTMLGIYSAKNKLDSSQPRKTVTFTLRNPKNRSDLIKKLNGVEDGASTALTQLVES